ncbi:MAG: hypothetical protein QOH61_1202 [Chloroflexota bacterium]|nr:hypothetical protein [Chloroflexota bacterium]
MALAERLRRPAYTADTTAAAAEALARSGIGTYAAPTDDSPELPVTGAASPLRLMDFQTHAVAVDAWAGNGLAGSELDVLLPIPAEVHDQSAPASAFVAGYVAAVDSPGAALARALMADQDLTRPQALRFPLIVLDLFASDLATDGGTRTATMPGAGTSAIQAILFNPQQSAGDGAAGQVGTATLCSDAAKFVDSTIHALFNLLKVAVPDNTVGAIVATIWNWIVDQGEAFVRGLIDAVTGAVLATVRAIAGSIAAIASQVTALVPYAVAVRVNPSSQIDLGNNRFIGAFVATVTAGDIGDWPDVMKDCASTAQVALPSFRGRDEPVTWGEPVTDAPGIVEALRSDSRTNEAGEASWVFGTGPDPGQAPGAERTSTVRIDVTIHRSALDDARKSLTDALFSGIPEVLRGFVGEIFSFFVDPLQAAVAALIDTHASGTATIVYHDQPAASPSPTTGATATPPSSDVCSLLTDQEVTAVIGVPVARREGTGTIQSGGSCVMGTVRQADLDNIYYVSIIIEPKGTLFPSAQQDAHAQAVSGVGDQAVYLTDAGAIIGVTGTHDFSLQVVVGGKVGGLGSATGIARILVSRL